MEITVGGMTYIRNENGRWTYDMSNDPVPQDRVGVLAQVTLVEALDIIAAYREKESHFK